jgi:hypothetical protein
LKGLSTEKKENKSPGKSMSWDHLYQKARPHQHDEQIRRMAAEAGLTPRETKLALEFGETGFSTASTYIRNIDRIRAQNPNWEREQQVKEQERKKDPALRFADDIATIIKSSFVLAAALDGEKPGTWSYAESSPPDLVACRFPGCGKAANPALRLCSAHHALDYTLWSQGKGGV